MGSIGIKTIMGSVVHTGMRRGTVVRRRTRNREVRGSYPAAVAIAIYHRLNLLSYNIKVHLSNRYKWH